MHGCHLPLPAVTCCHLLSPADTDCFLLLPTVTHFYPLLPIVTYSYLLLPTVTYRPELGELGNECTALPAVPAEAHAVPAGVCVHVRLRLSDTTSGEPAIISPYLGAAAHVFIAPADPSDWTEVAVDGTSSPPTTSQAAAVHTHAYAALDAASLRLNGAVPRLSRAVRATQCSNRCIRYIHSSCVAASSLSCASASTPPQRVWQLCEDVAIALLLTRDSPVTRPSTRPLLTRYSRGSSARMLR